MANNNIPIYHCMMYTLFRIWEEWLYGMKHLFSTGILELLFPFLFVLYTVSFKALLVDAVAACSCDEFRQKCDILVFHWLVVNFWHNISHILVTIYFRIISGVGLIENNSVILVASMLISPLMVSTLIYEFFVSEVLR